MTTDNAERLSESGAPGDARLIQAADRMVRDRLAFELHLPSGYRRCPLTDILLRLYLSSPPSTSGDERWLRVLQHDGFVRWEGSVVALTSYGRSLVQDALRSVVRASTAREQG